MKRRAFGLLFWFLFCLVGLKPAFALEEFETNYEVNYRVLPTGTAHVEQKVSLTNKLSHVYATHYTLTLHSSQVKNIQASDQKGPVKVKITARAEETQIDLEFNQAVVGKGKTLEFSLSYDLYDLVRKKGQVWEVSVPRLDNPEAISRYQLKLLVPASFGQPAFISPAPLETSSDRNWSHYSFGKEQLAESGVSAAFGELQIFEFSLTYHLENDSFSLTSQSIALPPDTAYQRVHLEKLEPLPENIKADSDGNWLAYYQLKGNQKLNIKAEGKVEIFAQPQENFPSPSPESLEENLQATEFWPINEPLIQKTAQGLETAQEIYDFVLKTLDYDYSRIKKDPQRLGPVKALENPGSSVCTEFSDLFISLARASKIPAREVNGYAHTTNPELQPLGLVADVLHSWPEYYDKKQKLWIPVDPTWEKTTGGVDYFSKLDLNHFVFAIHGKDDEKPSPAGAYKTGGSYSKDVQVSFSQAGFEPAEPVKVELSLDRKKPFSFKRGGRIIIQNPGATAAYQLLVSTESTHPLEVDNQLAIDLLPPLGQKAISFSLGPLFLKEARLTIALDDQVFEKTIEPSLPVVEGLSILALVALLTFALRRGKILRSK